MVVLFTVFLWGGFFDPAQQETGQRHTFCCTWGGEFAVPAAAGGGLFADEEFAQTHRLQVATGGGVEQFRCAAVTGAGGDPPPGEKLLKGRAFAAKIAQAAELAQLAVEPAGEGPPLSVQ